MLVNINFYDKDLDEAMKKLMQDYDTLEKDIFALRRKFGLTVESAPLGEDGADAKGQSAAASNA